jgi:hypothetical protein
VAEPRDLHLLHLLLLLLHLPPPAAHVSARRAGRRAGRGGAERDRE